MKYLFSIIIELSRNNNWL